MKNKKIILFLIIGLWNSTAFAEAGFQGHRSEISIDAFSLAERNELNFMYKFAITKTISAFVDYGKATLDGKMKTPIWGLSYIDETGYLNSYGPEDILSGKSKFSLSTFGLGVFYTTSIYNMHMPVGSYTGFGLFKSSGTMDETYNLKEGLAGNGQTIKYDLSQLNVRFLYGKDFVLTGLLTMDISLCVGYTFSSYTMKDATVPGLVPENPYGSYPQISFAGFSKKDDWTSDYDYNTGATTKYKSTNLYLTPSVRIGYIF